MADNLYKYIDESRKHLHTLNGNPLIGTSTASGIISKNLTWYAAGKAVEVFGVPDYKVLGKIDRGQATQQEKDELYVSMAKRRQELSSLTPQDYFDVIDEAYRAHDAHKRKKGKEGTARHERVSEYINSCTEGVPVTGKCDSSIQEFKDWSVLNVKRFVGSEVHCYADWPVGLGGITDICAEMNDGKYAVMDAKSSPKAYFDQFVQCALYNIQLKENGGLTRDGEKLFDWHGAQVLYVLPFGSPKLEPQPLYDIEGITKASLGALETYKYSLHFE